MKDLIAARWETCALNKRLQPTAYGGSRVELTWVKILSYSGDEVCLISLHPCLEKGI